MDTERNCLELLLRRVRYLDIELDAKEKDISYNRVGEKKFLKIANTALRRYSGDELYQMYRWLVQTLEKIDIKGNSQGIFSYIAGLADQFLEIKECISYHKGPENQILKKKEYKFICREYAGTGKIPRDLQFLRWRELSVSLGNDIFMAALLALEGTRDGALTDLLCTPFPTFDEAYKDKVGMRGMADNHFHLKGSIPVFNLNWVCIMNHIGDANSRFFLHFGRYLEPDVRYDEEQAGHNTLVGMCRQAAFYRLYLYHVLNKNKCFLESPIFQTMELEEEELSELQEQINVCRGEQETIEGPQGGIECLDYAAGGSWGSELALRDEHAVAGERYFLYCCFMAAFHDEFDYRQKNIFYRYLVIRLRVRSELVQVNGKRGFSNFAEYQDRKEDFIEDYPSYKEQLMKLAVKSPSRLQNLASIELRITPKDHIETLKRIVHYDESMMGDPKDILPDYFYVLHFPKRKDAEFKELKPRNYVIRDYLDSHICEEYALLEKERSDYDHFGKIPRVRGYDTCSSEIGCRPEVFGQFYRQLQDYNKRNGMEQVRFTYHVGEDFLDIFSGLRAIDEALLFCCIPEGGRIGHGMVLGIDAGNYYSLKKNSSVLEKQEILDNIAWTLGFCREHGIVIHREIESEMLKRFEGYLEEIYGGPGAAGDREYAPDANPQPGGGDTPDGNAQEGGRTTPEEEAGREAAAAQIENPPVYQEYYSAWKLRGDRPYKYWKEDPGMGVDSADTCCFTEGKHLEIIRCQEACRDYYRKYHFNQDVREKGGQPDIWKVNELYYGLATRIQEELRRILTEREIAVECNPSSNYLIGPFQKYDEHPMLRMYGKNLRPHPSALMNVSINTDDQGVFHTSLEMEYAVLYTALSKSRDEKGRPRYTEEDIKQWFKDVNEFGRRQLFRFPGAQ